MSEEKTKVEAKAETITISKNALWKYSTVILGIALVLVIAFAILPGKSSTGAVVGTQPGNNLPTQPAQVVAVDIGNAPIKGDVSSNIFLLEWSDYECPFCQRFYQQSLSTVLDEKIQLGFKDFPLSFHQNADGAANAARCAGEQKKYWEMHDLLFGQGVEGGISTFKGYAKQIGLDTEKFNTCLDSKKYESKIQEDQTQGSNIGIQGTPGFVLGTKKGSKVEGRLISGACPASTFQQAIAAEKAKKDWTVTNCQFAEF